MRYLPGTYQLLAGESPILSSVLSHLLVICWPSFYVGWRVKKSVPKNCIKKSSNSWYIPFFHTNSTAQGGGGSFKNRKPIGEVGCCESGMAERSHWWTERCLISLTLSLSFAIFLSFSLSFSDYLSIYLSIYPSIYLSKYPSIYPSIHPSTFLSIHLPIHPSIHPSILSILSTLMKSNVDINAIPTVS